MMHTVETLDKLIEIAEKEGLNAFQVFSAAGAILRRAGWTVIAMVGNSELYIRPEKGGQHIVVKFSANNGAAMLRAIQNAIGKATTAKRHRGRTKKQQQEQQQQAEESDGDTE